MRWRKREEREEEAEEEGHEASSRRLYIAMYRDGLRSVLTDAVVSLEEMIGE